MKNTTINISLSETLLNAVDKQAQYEYRNRSELIREALRQYLLEKSADATHNSFTVQEMNRIDSLTDELDKGRKWIYTSLVFRPQPNSIPDLFSGSSSKVTELVEHPGGLRHAGWDLETLDRARPVAGEYLQVMNGNRKILRIYRDGQVLFAGDEDFVGWGVNKDKENADSYNINALALTELLTNFVKFGFDLSKHLENDPNYMTLKLGFFNPERKMVTLSLIRKGMPFHDQTKPAAVNAVTTGVRINLNENNFDLPAAAYKFVSEMYYLFGIREDEFWYVDKTKKKVDLEHFKE